MSNCTLNYTNMCQILVVNKFRLGWRGGIVMGPHIYLLADPISCACEIMLRKSLVRNNLFKKHTGV